MFVFVMTIAVINIWLSGGATVAFLVDLVERRGVNWGMLLAAWVGASIGVGILVYV